MSTRTRSTGALRTSAYALSHSRNITVLILIPIILSTFVLGPGGVPIQPRLAATVDPLGSFQGTSVAAPLYWTGDGQRINNTSFENGLQPWTQTQTNAAVGSSASVASSGYGDNKSAMLTVLSGNFTPDSKVSLANYVSRQQIGFGGALRLRTTVQVTALAGNTTGDTVEETITLTTSTGGTRHIHYFFADAGTLPTNSTLDAFFKVPGFGSIGQWIVLDRNMSLDALAAFPSDYANLNSVSLIQLVVSARTFGIQNRDPHLKFYDLNNDGTWDMSEQVVYDANLNGVYDNGEPVLYGSTPSNGTVLSVDPRIKFVDSNNDGVWVSGDSIVYDTNNNGIYDVEPAIYGPPVKGGTLLMRPIQKVTTALFDQVELYSATGNYDWIHNGNFDTGTLAGWGQNSTLTFSKATSRSPQYSAEGTVTGGAMEMAQSIDARPRVESWMRLKASAEVSNMTGNSSIDAVDIWLGLVDNRGRPVAIYYYFKTGDGTIPSNTTDTIYHRALGFGSLNTWVSVDASLLNETVAFDQLGYSSPYRLEVIVVEGAARGALSTTTAFFDDISVYQPYKPSSAPSQFYTIAGLNSTYTYTAANIPYGGFYIDIPLAQSVLNITSPEGAALPPGEYATQPEPGMLRVTVPSSTMFKHIPLGIWRVYATSTDALSTLYVENSTSKIPRASFNTSALADLVSRTQDPVGVPQAGASVNLTLFETTNATVVATWSGTADTQGWYNVTGKALPSKPGNYTLQATVQSAYVGVRTYIVMVTSPPGTQQRPESSEALLGLVGGASAAVILAFLFVFWRRRRHRSGRPTSQSLKPIDTAIGT